MLLLHDVKCTPQRLALHDGLTWMDDEKEVSAVATDGAQTAYRSQYFPL